MKNQWREYKEWLDMVIPSKVSKYLWHRDFEKVITLFIVIGLLYLVAFVVFGKELLQKVSTVFNTF